MYDSVSTGKPNIMTIVCEDCEMDIVKQTKKSQAKKERKLDPPYLFYFILFSNIFIPVV